MAGVFTAMGLTFIAFEGYEIIVQAGRRGARAAAEHPPRRLLSLAIVIPIYLLVAFVAIGAVDTGSAAAHLAVAGQGRGAQPRRRRPRQFMPFGTELHALRRLPVHHERAERHDLLLTRVSFAMGRDHNFPDAFARIHRARRTPVSPSAPAAP